MRPPQPNTIMQPIITIGCVVFLIIQIGLPFILLWSPRPVRWGWQMYSTITEVPSVTLVLNDDTTQPVDLGQHIGYIRAEMQLTERLPAYLCRMYPQAQAVQYQATASSPMQEFVCQ